jgi:hypothetical protein
MGTGLWLDKEKRSSGMLWHSRVTLYEEYTIGYYSFQKIEERILNVFTIKKW